MDKFTNFTKVKEEQGKKAYDVLWHNDYMQVINVEGWSAVSEKDMVVIIPFLQEYNQIIMRLEHVPPYKLKKPDVDKFLTVVSESIEPGETPAEAVRRGLKEELGYGLREDFEIEISKPLFVSKGNTNSYYCCILSLMEHDYTEFTPTTDGSDAEAMASNIKIDTKYINTLVTQDVITAYMLELLKNNLGIK